MTDEDPLPHSSLPVDDVTGPVTEVTTERETPEEVSESALGELPHSSKTQPRETIAPQVLRQSESEETPIQVQRL